MSGKRYNIFIIPAYLQHQPQVLFTPVIALFLILSATGILLMLHAGGDGTKAIHEWLGIAFILFGFLHALANWSLNRRYLRGRKGAIIVMAVIFTLGISGVTSSESKAPPIKSVYAAVLQAPLKNVAFLCNTEPEAVAGQLRDQGFSVAGTDRSLEEIALRNNTRPDILLSLIIPASEGRQH